MKNDILIFTQWLQELKGNKEELKLMLYIGANADIKNNVCKCSLKDFREWLGQTSNTNNKKNIARLNNLQEKNYISYSNIGNTYYITINTKNMNKIDGVQKQWLEQIRIANRNKDYKKIDNSIKVDWLQTFYLFVNIHLGTIRNLTTQTQLANILNVSKPTINGALKLLNLCNFDNISCKGLTAKEKVQYEYENINENNEKIIIIYEQTRNIGTHIDYIDYRESAF